MILLKCKEYKDLGKDDLKETMDLLDNHPSLPGNRYLTEKIMIAASRTDKAVIKRKHYAFEMKLANSFICTGIVMLMSNIIAMQKDIFLAEGLRENILSFNQLIAEIFSKLSGFNIF